MTTHIELAPASCRQDWEKACAFAIAAGAPAYVSLWLISARSVPVTLIAGTICLVGVFIVALSVSTRSSGRLTLIDDCFQFDGGSVHLRVPLAELNLAAARPGDDAKASPRLVTRVSHAVTIPRHAGVPVVVTPLDSAGFLQALRTHAG